MVPSFKIKLISLDLEWLNSSRPLSMRGDLKGKLVLIDFWTYCCINCMHVIPILNQLEQKFKEVDQCKFITLKKSKLQLVIHP